MRKQFGEKPEPWLDLEGQDFDLAEEAGQPPASESAPGKSWTELPNSEEFPQDHRIDPAHDAARSPRGRHRPDDTASRASMARISNTPPPTDSKMGWESRPARTGATSP